MLQIGDKAPDFSLPDQNGTMRTLSRLTAQKAVVLFFYPKDETPGCTMEACAFRDIYEDFLLAGAEVLGLSTDSRESHLAFVENRRLPFLLLSDTDGMVLKAFGADKRFMGILKARITFLIDRQGIIRHVFSSQISPRKHASSTLEALKKLNELKD